ncbi:molybdopterin-dependent oxidoreductase [Variovorax robiniae]|uniref:Molybdopterin-dependent oxidoreductase n=1 Tax=Variovorax robiniae TaxID=1836199 RepID=A0ABU8X6W7_9BURK
MKETKSTCPYCGVGCGVIIESQGDQITGVRGDPDHPANFGRLCTKGSTLHLTASAEVTRQTRLLQPMQRLERNAAPQPVTWDTALDTAADKFAAIIRDHGPDAVGFYVSGQLLTEDYYVFNKLAKGLVGTNNIDTNSRLCMSSAVAGYKKTLGADSPPACYDDFKDAQCLFIVGSNTAWAHPILFRRIEDAKLANPAMKIIVADLRRTDTAEIADLFLPIQPGTDVMLFHGMLHLMLWEGWTKPEYIAAHTTGFDALKTTVRDCTPDKVAQTCGIDKADLLEAARLFATSAATLSLYCQGLNQSSSGTAKNAALINLHLATAQIGKPGAGPFSLTGQPNAMGGREVGGLANLLSAHRDMSNATHRAEVAALWGVPDVPAIPGKTAVEMFQAAADGEIKALWIACTNPAQSMPDQATVRRALERAEFVVVQEAFATTATCAYADLLLPATTWGEKTGTVTNSERRISRVRPAVAAPGATRHDWSAATDFAQRLEARLPTRASTTLFPYLLDNEVGAESIWNEHRESTRGRDLDITGLSWPMLDAQGPQQWPLPEGASTGRIRLYEDGRFPTPDGRARFVDTPYKPLAEQREARFPFSLNTGRLRDQWHGMSRTGTLGRLFGHVAEPVVQMHPQDMARRHLKEGDLVHLTSRRGSIVLPAQASREVGMSQAFVAMHWGEEYLSGLASNGERLAGINALTTPAFCPDSKQPELKHAAIKILKAELPWSLLAAAWLPDGTALSTRQQLRELMKEFPFASCVPFGAGGALSAGAADRTGLLFRAAGHEAAPDALLARIESLLGLAAADTLRYADVRHGQRRAARLVRSTDVAGEAHLEGFLLAGDTRAEAWITALLRGQLPAQSFGRQLLRPGATAPVGVAARGKIVCSCFGVTETAIVEKLQGCTGNDEQRLAALQGALQCGTNCGSCIPELKRMVRTELAEAAL